MKRLLSIIAATAAAAVLLGSAFASSPAPQVTPATALQQLMDGNQRYIDNQLSGIKSCDLEARKKLSSGQAPYAIILSCSDSRVPPELIFDEGLGEIFVVRVAGNVTDPIVLGSVEYAAEHLGTPLIMVLGHTKCGAVKATVEANGKAEGNIGEIVKSVAPALKKAKAAKTKPADKGQFIETVVDENIKEVKANLTRKSNVLSHLVKEGKVKIVTAKYDIDNGKVTIQEGLK
jgi:carbonic anhydrase